MVEWKRQRIDWPYRALEGRAEDHVGLSGTLLRVIMEEPLSERTLLDVGCGSGRLSFALTREARRIIGIDRSAEAIVRARDRALALGLDHVTFVCCDAETIDYRDLGPIDLVVANLCMSDEILRRAAAVLEPERFIAFAAFHQDQWRESGKTSRYAYAEGRLETALLEAGFEPVYLGVEQEVVHFADQDEALSYLESAGLAGKWKTDGRWEGFLIYLKSGGRDLTTKAHVIVKARRR
jgi:ubiquinone/menaquinone biosynthesis C-methylase UbiE